MWIPGPNVAHSKWLFLLELSVLFFFFSASCAVLGKQWRMKLQVTWNNCDFRRKHQIFFWPQKPDALYRPFQNRMILNWYLHLDHYTNTITIMNAETHWCVWKSWFGCFHVILWCHSSAHMLSISPRVIICALVVAPYYMTTGPWPFRTFCSFIFDCP